MRRVRLYLSFRSCSGGGGGGGWLQSVKQITHWRSDVNVYIPIWSNTKTAATTTTMMTPTTEYEIINKRAPNSQQYTEVNDQTSPQPCSIQNEHFITNYFCMTCRTFQIKWKKKRKYTESELCVLGLLLTQFGLQLFTHPDFEILFTFKFEPKRESSKNERTNNLQQSLNACVFVRLTANWKPNLRHSLAARQTWWRYDK